MREGEEIVSLGEAALSRGSAGGTLGRGGGSYISRTMGEASPGLVPVYRCLRVMCLRQLAGPFAGYGCGLWLRPSDGAGGTRHHSLSVPS